MSDGSLPSNPGVERTENLALRSPTTSTTTAHTEGSRPMSGSTSTAPEAITPGRRVRHEVRDGVAVMVFSAVSSCGVALLLTLVARLGSQA